LNVPSWWDCSGEQSHQDGTFNESDPAGAAKWWMIVFLL